MATVNLGSTNAADANNGALSQDKTEFHSDCKDAPFGFCFPVMSIVLDKQSFDKSLIAVEVRKKDSRPGSFEESKFIFLLLLRSV